jgi:hypothetical protein
LDYALKYTYKNGESLDENYKNISAELVANEQKNINLLQSSLKVIKAGLFHHKTLAPLHGFDFASFEKYQKDILKLEEKLSVKFDGFALGGIGKARDFKDEIWKVPQGLNRDEKATWIVSRLARNARRLTLDGFLHVLAAGNIKSIPFLIREGVTSSDCHSAWRRASEGKIIIPLFDEKLNFIKNKKTFEYVKLEEVSHYNFPNVAGFSVNDILKLSKSTDKEDRYYASILIFIFALYQYDSLIQFIQRNSTNYLEILTNTPDENLNKFYKRLTDLLM